jgi:UDP:flavonoid glycosyltransferase YjiC (YdhE family)
MEKLHTNLRAQQMLKRLARKVSLRWVREVGRFRAELGLPTDEHPLFEGSFSPHGVLALFSKELAAPQPDWPPHTTQTGYCFYDRKGTLYGDDRYIGSLAYDIETFLQQGDEPVIFTLGSAAVFDARNFYIAAVEAMRALNKRAILLIGNEANRPANLPQNGGQIAAFEYAPFSELFPRGAAVVHQGGAGTTGQVLRARVPSIVMPYSHDQPDHAMRLQRLGVGRTLPRPQYNAATLAGELGTLLGDASFALKAREIGARMQKENGTVAAVDVIERQLDI